MSSHTNVLFEVALRARISDTRKRMEDLSVVLSQLSGGEELALLKMVIESAIEDNMNAYEEACVFYFDGEVDPGRFEKLYRREILQLVQTHRAQFGPDTAFPEILRAYRMWEGEPLTPSKLAFQTRVARLHRAKKVITDTAQIYAIAPEQLVRVAYQNNPGDPKAEKVIKEHGGTVFNTGTDGELEVRVPAEEEAKAFRARHRRASLQNLLKTEFPGVSVWVYEIPSRDLIVLSKIVVPEEQRNLGLGRAIMHRILRVADAKRMTVALTPTSDFGGSLPRLLRFYRSFGFVPNSGRKKDYSISETMYRLPQ